MCNPLAILGRCLGKFIVLIILVAAVIYLLWVYPPWLEKLVENIGSIVNH